MRSSCRLLRNRSCCSDSSRVPRRVPAGWCGRRAVICRVARTSGRHRSTRRGRACERVPRGRRGDRRRFPPTRTRVRSGRRVRDGLFRGVDRVRGGPTSASTRPVSHSREATRRSSTEGAPPMPMFPSRSSAVRQRPWPGTRSKIDRRSTGAPRRRAMASAGREMSMPRVTMPASASARAWRAGPQPMSSTGPSTRASNRCSAGETGSNHRWAGAGRTRPSIARRHGTGDGG